MRPCTECESGIEAHNDRTCCIFCVYIDGIGRHPQPVTETHRLKVLQPFTFPGTVCKFLYAMLRQSVEAESSQEVLFERMQIGIDREHARDPRIRPQRRFVRAGYQHGVVAGITERNSLCAVSREYFLYAIRAQTFNIHHELAPPHSITALRCHQCHQSPSRFSR